MNNCARPFPWHADTAIVVGASARRHSPDSPEAAMYVHRSARIRSIRLTNAILIGLLISTVAVRDAAAATSGFTITSSTSVQFWVNDAPWADLHYQINGGTQLNVRMVANGNNHTFDVSPVAAGSSCRVSVNRKTTTSFWFHWVCTPGNALDPLAKVV